MKKMIVFALLFFGAGCIGGEEPPTGEVSMPAQASIDTDPKPQEMPIVTEVSKKLYEDNCSTCHSLERPGSMRKSYDGWLSTVHRMTVYGAEFSDEEAEHIAAYLAQEHGM